MTHDLHDLIKVAARRAPLREIQRETGVPKTLLIRWRDRPFQGMYVPSDSDLEYAQNLTEFVNNLDVQDADEGVTIEDHEDGTRRISGTVSGRVMKYEEVFDLFGLSADEWECPKLVCKPYTVSMKLKQVEEQEDGTFLIVERPHQSQSYSLHVTLKPRHEAIQKIEALDRVIQRLEEGAFFSPSDTRPPHERSAILLDSHLLVINIADLHLGKMALREDWTIKDAMAMHGEALEQFIGYAHGLEVDRILIWYGNDLTNMDTVRSETTRGTIVESNDTWYNCFDAAVQLGADTINRLLEVAQVDVAWVGGNHDWHTSYGVIRVLMAMFKHNPDVRVMTGEQGRLMYQWDNTILLGDHGNNAKAPALAMSLAIDYPKEWAASEGGSREVHTGHLHFAKTQNLVSSYTTEYGVTIRQAPSLSPRDAWHHTHGFIGGVRAAEAYLYRQGVGHVGTINYKPENKAA